MKMVFPASFLIVYKINKINFKDREIVSDSDSKRTTTYPVFLIKNDMFVCLNGQKLIKN